MCVKSAKAHVLISTIILLATLPISGTESAPVAKSEFLTEIGKMEARIQKLETGTTEQIGSVEKQFEEKIAEQNVKIDALGIEIRGLAEKLGEISELLRESKDGFDRSVTVNQDLLYKELEIKGLQIAKMAASVRETQNRIETATGQLAGETESRNAQYAEINNALTSLEAAFEKNTDGLTEIRTELSNANRSAQVKIRDISGTVSRGTLYWIAAVFAVAFLSLIFFVILRKTISKKADTLDGRIRDTKEALDAEAVRLEARLAQLLQTGLAGESKPDHSFYLKTGLEIHRMRKRLENMAEDAKGLNALKHSLRRLENEYNENGYDIVDLIGKPYAEGMTAVARFVPSANGKADDNIITRVIKPQINYKGVLIEPAEVEVGKGD